MLVSQVHKKHFSLTLAVIKVHLSQRFTIAVLLFPTAAYVEPLLLLTAAKRYCLQFTSKGELRAKQVASVARPAQLTSFAVPIGRTNTNEEHSLRLFNFWRFLDQ